MAVERENGRKIVIVGCGPGGVEYVTPAARKAVEGAEVVLGSRRLLDLFPDCTAEKITLPTAVEPALETIAKHYAPGKVAVLVSGDPGLFSLAKAVIRRFGSSACEVIPGISVLQVAFARLGLDWSDARIISAHGRLPQAPPEELAAVDTIALFAGTPHAAGWAGRLAVELAVSHRVHVCENLTLADERVRLVRPGELAAMELASLSLIVFVRNDGSVDGQQNSSSAGA
ncbi:MAG: precorrin-6y C5,15-methyltransferase (decarboxylating) subunit CbiE [Thermoguttaceae bacterium]